MPKVTVLMAVYNGERFLREAIDSILAQSFRDFEFLIINDGSTDNTREIVQSYSDPRIRLVDNGCNLGLTRSLNRGLELAEGQFIARQDADDISEPERLSRQVAFLEAHPEVVLLGTWYKEIDAQGNVVGNRELPCDYTQICWSLLFFCPFVHSSVMFRRAVVQEPVGFYDESFVYAQDYDLWCRITRHYSVANLNQYLLKLRIQPWSMTSTYGVTIFDEDLRIRITNIGQILGWDKDKIVNFESRFNRMRSFLLGYEIDFSKEEMKQMVEDILWLQTAFSRNYRISPTDSSSHRAQVCIDISRRISAVAIDYAGNENTAVAWQLFFEACRLHWPILFQRKSLLLFLRLLIGPRLIRAIKRFTCICTQSASAKS
jgi:glycosyltransferase involved in cell wall biosynthesis